MTNSADPLPRLREATRPAHERIEKQSLLQPVVTGHGLTRPAYRRLLSALHGYYARLEVELVPRVERLTGSRAGPENDTGDDAHWCYRPRSPLLRADLDDLDPDTEPERANVGAVDAEEADIPLPETDSAGRTLGVLYVIEGATRGGRVVTPRLERILGYGPLLGGRYFGLDHNAGNRHWHRFTGFLTRQYEPAQEADMLASACATFTTLDAHLARAAATAEAASRA